MILVGRINFEWQVEGGGCSAGTSARIRSERVVETKRGRGPGDERDRGKGWRGGR